MHSTYFSSKINKKKIFNQNLIVDDGSVSNSIDSL